MASVNTLFKNILNVKNTVIENCNLYSDENWLRKFRREAGEQMELPTVTAPTELAFAEIPIPVPTSNKSVEDSGAVAVIHAGSITLKVSNDISESLLRVLLQEVTHV